MSIPSFVKSNIDLMRFLKRIEKRTARYPEWRQIYFDCSGVCQYPVGNDNAEICGEMEAVEYHEIWDDSGNLIDVALLCNYHHNSIHNGIVNPRFYSSMSARDIEIEMLIAGGSEQWLKKFNIVKRSKVYAFTNNDRNGKDDLQFSEDSKDNGN